MKLPSQSSLRSHLLAFLLLIAAPIAASEQKEIDWIPTFDKAAEIAKKDHKPLFVYFAGSDWCSWCQKMDSEILTSPDFIQEIGPKFVFYMADFPVYKELDKPIAAKNEELKKTYNIVGFPTIVLLTPEMHEFAKLNYREGGGKVYASHVSKLLSEQESFEKGMNNLKKENLTSLQSMYERACRLGLENAQHEIVQEGCTRGDIAYFMKERYKELLADNQINSPEAQKIKARILALDPSNRRRLHYDVALIEFEALSKNLVSEEDAIKAVKPLQDYLISYGNKDLKTRWKIEMIIAQTLASKNQVADALSYAQASEQHAPPRHKASCQEVIADLTKQESTSFIAHEEEQ